MAKLPWKSWHEVVKLRDDLKSGELPLHMFAADLYEVMMQNGKRPIYEKPENFFALTFPTHNLRNLVRDVVLRLAGKNDKAECTITMAEPDFQKLVENPQANGMQLFFAGKLKVQGNQMLAMKLQKLFSYKN